MAIEPYRKRTNVPSSAGGGAGQMVNTNVQDIGPTISAFGQSLTAAAEPYLKKRAIEQAQKDFGAMGLGKDENGNYTIPDTPAGAGLVYAQTFEQVSKSQFLRQTETEVKARLVELYGSEENAFKSAAELEPLAQEYTQGVIDAAPDEMKPMLIDSLSREVAMFHSQRSSQDLNAYVANTRNTAKVQNQQIADEIENVAMVGPNFDPAGDMISGLMGDYEESLDQMIALDLMDEEGKALAMIEIQKWIPMGQVMGTFRAERMNKTGYETELLVQMLRGNAPEGSTAYGYDQEMLRELLPTREMSDEVARRIGEVVGEMKQADIDRAKAAEMDNLLDSLVEGQGFGGISADKQDAVAVLYAQRVGVDPLSGEGAQAIYARFGVLPENFYNNRLGFDSMNQWSFDVMQQRLPLLETLRTLRSGDGSVTNVLEAELGNDASKFFGIFRAQMLSENDDEEGRRTAFIAAKDTFAAVKGADTATLRAYALRESEFDTDKEMQSDLAKYLGVNSMNSLGPKAEEWAYDYLGSLLAGGANYHDAKMQMRDRFQQNWVQNPFDVTYRGQLGLTGDIYELPFGFTTELPQILRTDRDPTKGGWVHKSEALPDLPGASQRDFLVSVVDHALDEVADVSGLPVGADKLVFGQNVVSRFIANGPDGSRVFALYYDDPNDRATPQPIIDKEGNFLQIDFGRAAGSLFEDHEAWVAGKAVAEKTFRKTAQKLKGNPTALQNAVDAYYDEWGELPYYPELFRSNDAIKSAVGTIRRESEQRRLPNRGFRDIETDDYLAPRIRRQENRAMSEQVAAVKLGPEADGPMPVRAVNSFMSSGLFTNQLDAIALAGNLQTESGADFAQRSAYGDTNLNRTGGKRDERAIGLAQWRLERRDAFKEWSGGMTIEDSNKLPGNEGLEMQLAFIAHEMQTTHKSAWVKVQKARTLRDKVLALRKYYFGAATAHDAKRIAYAERLARRMGQGN